MRPFIPLQVREILHGPVGIDYELSCDLQEYADLRAVGNCADGMLPTGIKCILVGYRDAAKELLTKCKTWYEYAIETEEKPKGYVRGFTEATRHGNLALSNWLLSGSDDLENQRKSVEYSIEHDLRPDQIDKTSTSIVLPEYIDGRAYAAALSLFEATPGMKKPASPGQVRTEGQMSYLIAAMHERKEYSLEEVTEALSKFLNRSVARLLGEGQSAAVARWMKIAHVNEAAQRRV